MTSLVRLALTWLLVLALPVQGYAASSLRWCGMAPQRGSATAAPHDHAAMLAAMRGAGSGAGAGAGAAVVMNADQGGVPSHHAATSDAAAPEAAAASVLTHTGTGMDAGKTGAHGGTDAGKCSACAACCGAPALASMGLVVAVVPAAPPYGAVAMAALTGTTPEAFERPPRASGR